MVDDPTPQERAAHFGPGGPVEAAKKWLDDVVMRTDIRAAWLNTDPDYRLALTQAIIFLNEQHPVLGQHDRDELAGALAEESPEHPLWESFADLLAEEFLRDLGEVRVDNLTTATPRPVTPGYELVLFPHGRRPASSDEPPEMYAHGVLVHFRDGRWLIAGLSERRAVPGWPPDLGY